VQSRWYPRSYWGQIARKVREKLDEATLIFWYNQILFQKK
jgi:hypothetical protein